MGLALVPEGPGHAVVQDLEAFVVAHSARLRDLRERAAEAERHTLGSAELNRDGDGAGPPAGSGGVGEKSGAVSEGGSQAPTKASGLGVLSQQAKT
jgi:hypothetical protein